ncbi:TetR/AcrR family transcriptional regulator [Pseudomonas sp. SWRI74]|jgi:AcrR family transcriptional regulator|uniref:TetR/AcrR family transcriptional regulator n=1 Tax=Pseudomonas azerbaijanoccidentalis TaxID=2842347 RepID=A0ABS6QUB1_9PSED|nr:TetR/AcrR family transcriptional regulator [Pseudomonas azerbaijanoccidentalis]MBV4522147.1 TetR/AcrR family transcriptional regulator [Pseudomonas azerbaijanoccidentalis]MCK8667412.1 TetR/AcrR family transcriptional regulator [Pseudomonas azerbaijanoccidentalis]
MNMTESTIRLAAIKLISRNGYESMSLRQLAAESGINASTLYLYYKGKSELLLELILEYLQGLSHEWKRRRPAVAANAALKLRAFIACHVRYHLEHQDQAVLGNLEFRSLDEDSLALVRQARRVYLKGLQDLLEQGVREGSLSCAEPKLMARTLFNMLTHACVWYQADGRWSVDDVIRHYSDLVMKMLGAVPVATPRAKPREARS